MEREEKWGREERKDERKTERRTEERWREREWREQKR